MWTFIMKVDTAQEYHTVALENTDEQQKQRTSQTRLRRSRTRRRKPTCPWIEGTYREPSITKGAMLSRECWRKPDTSHGVVTNHKVTLKKKH